MMSKVYDNDPREEIVSTARKGPLTADDACWRMKDCLAAVYGPYEKAPDAHSM
jgi:hypothetical protein